ncbi:MAG: fluoride efflux transporter CrcB [Limnobacter sp.]|nr:fluoride efflux transporter CrcB [Limnobacter sp.]
MPVGPTFTISGFVAVGIGAVLGAWARWALGLWLNAAGRPLPLGTLVANLIGGLMIGMLVAAFSRLPDLDPAWRLFAITGFLGALTTFSSFSIESLGLIQRGEFGWALLHSGLHLFGSLLLAAVGYRLAS